jgi:hypothetical protein
MWIPKSEAEIRAVVDAGELSETTTFDAKKELPTAKRSIDLAIDVAAMATDGGVLLYGVDEDAQGQPTVLAPVPLAGVRERVDNIVRSCIAEPPTIEVATIPTEADPAVGYVVLAVPPSPRAPHMVIKDKDHRYYGRSATGNVRLSEGDVARLYERRQRWEVDRDTLLQREVERSPQRPQPDFAFLYLVVRPVAPDDRMLDRAKSTLYPQAPDARPVLNTLLRATIEPDIFPRQYAPDLDHGPAWQRVADGWRMKQGYSDAGQPWPDLGQVLEYQVDLDGSGHLFCGRAAERRDDRLLIFEVLIAGQTTRFLHLLGGIYEVAGYVGPVDVGLAVTGLRGGSSVEARRRLVSGRESLLYDRDDYRRTGRFAAAELRQHPRTCARELTEFLFRATTGETYDPFAGLES